MLKKERAAYIEKRLAELYPDPPIPLDHSNNFTLLVAVLLSAQCTDLRVNQVTPALFALADNATDMCLVDEQIILDIVKPCGLAPRKGKAIADLSRILVDKHGGEVPQDWEALEALPGVGHKTASVVMSQGFGVPSVPVDTHVHRLAQRWGLTDGTSVVKTERDFKKLFPAASWNALHLQFIMYGREFCTARGCDGRVCEICRTCYPKRKKPFIAKKP